MGNSVRCYLGYGYGLVQEHVPSGTPVLSYQHQRDKVYMLRVQVQAKQAAHTRPAFSISFSKEHPFDNTELRARK
jgi:hypothetical protein